MGKVGSYAGVIFEVKPEKIQTFDEFTQSGSARWSVHDILKHKPKPEFIGPGLDEIRFVMSLRSSFGVNPKTVIHQLRNVRDTGKTAPLVIGNKPISTNNWFLESLSEKHVTYDNYGNLISAEVEVLMKEYPKSSTPPPRVVPSNKTTTSSQKKSSFIGVVKIHVKSVNIRSGPSLQAKVVDWAMRNDRYRAYGKTKTDIEWFVLGGGKYISANSNYVTFEPGGGS